MMNRQKIQIISGMIVSLIFYFMFRQIFFKSETKTENLKDSVNYTQGDDMTNTNLKNTIKANSYWLIDGEELGVFFETDTTGLFKIESNTYSMKYNIEGVTFESFFSETNEELMNGTIVFINNDSFAIDLGGDTVITFHYESSFYD